ncbi:hypothetical protein [Globicatella sanguinis]
MKKHIKTIALIATGLVVGVVVGRVNGIKNKEITITDLEENLLVSIKGNEIIQSESVLVFIY